MAASNTVSVPGIGERVRRSYLRDLEKRIQETGLDTAWTVHVANPRRDVQLQLGRQTTFGDVKRMLAEELKISPATASIELTTERPGATTTLRYGATPPDASPAMYYVAVERGRPELYARVVRPGNRPANIPVRSFPYLPPPEEDRYCLYVSGGVDNKSGSWETSCDPSIFEDPYVAQNVVPAIRRIPVDGTLDAPELDLRFRSIPVRGIAAPAIVYMQRNSKSGTVRTGAYYPERLRREVQSAYNRTFSSPPEQERMLRYLNELGDTAVQAKIQAMLRRETELQNELTALRAQLARAIDPNVA